MPRSRSDLANTAVRIFLQEIGKEYDHARGLEPWKKKHLRETVFEFFGGRCCYCGTELEPAQVHGDHLVPINRTDLGLDAWGNVVPSCNACNSAKHGDDWRDFIIQRAGPEAAERHERMRQFLTEYSYDPPNDLRDIVDDLYREVGKIGMALVNLKIERVKNEL